MKAIKYVYGPYINKKDSRRNVEVHYDDGSKKFMSHARYVVEQAIGRELDRWEETVDHLDENPLNDSVSNLAIVCLANNSSASVWSTRYYFTCPICGDESWKPWRTVKHNWKRSPNGPFCSHSCSGRASRGNYGRTEGRVIEERFMDRTWQAVTESHGVPPDFAPYYPRFEKPSPKTRLCEICGNRLKSGYPHDSHIRCSNRVNKASGSSSTSKRTSRTRKSKECSGCGKSISSSAARCKSCVGKSQPPKIDWPPVDEVTQMVAESNYSAVGRKLGVSDNAVRKYIKRSVDA